MRVRARAEQVINQDERDVRAVGTGTGRAHTDDNGATTEEVNAEPSTPRPAALVGEVNVALVRTR